MILPDPGFWNGKRVLVTGHTGFKGSWLVYWLSRLGARVTGYALAPNSTPSLFEALRLEQDIDSVIGDLADAAALRALVQRTTPDVVFHLAAQALVRPSYDDPLGTFATNVLGTAHVLDALRDVDSVRAVVAVTTDKVYRNEEWCHPYREEDSLGGHDPYSASKAASEMVIDCYRASFLAVQDSRIASARAGNVIGGGDWSRDRLIPDAARAWERAATLEVRRPGSVRPWQHVLEPVRGYLILAERLWSGDAAAPAFNFGPYTHEAADVRSVIEIARHAYGSGDVDFATEVTGPHEAGLLRLDISKARSALGIEPRWPLATAVERTMEWYRHFANGADARALCDADLAAYGGDNAAPHRP